MVPSHESMPNNMMMSKDYGEPLTYDPDFNGPLKNRSCTDIFWLLLFLVGCAGWIYVGVYGIQRGDAVRLLAPVDTRGHHCGLDAGYEEKPYLVFFDIIQCATPNVALTGCPTQQVCVERCPNTSMIFASVANPDRTIFDQLVCQYHVDKSAITSREQMMGYINSGECASYILESQSVLSRCIGSDLSILSCRSSSTTARPLLNRAGGPEGAEGAACVRDPLKTRTTLLSRATALDTYVGLVAAGWLAVFTDNTPQIQTMATKIVEDLVAARYYMLGAVGAVVVLCFLYILLLRWVVAPLVWASLLGLIALLSFACYKCYENYVNYKETLSSGNNIMGYLESIFYTKNTWLVLTILLAVLTVVLLLLVVFLRKRIVIAIALIKEASKAVTANTTTIAYPILPFLLQCAVAVFGVVSLVFLLSVGTSQYSVVGLAADTSCQCTTYTDGASCTPDEFNSQCTQTSTNTPCLNTTCHFTGVENPTIVKVFLGVEVLGFFWVMFFIQGMADLTLAGTFSQWYWTFDKRNLPFFTLTRGIYRAVRYHMGTVALGSLIIAIVRVIRLILEYIDRKLKKFDNAFVRAVLCLCKCCFFMLESFLKFINKNAYIMCAVHGGGFCKSARDAFNLLMRNILRVFVLDKLTDFLFLVSKLLIAGGTGAAVYYLMDLSYLYEELGGQRLHYNAVPAVVLAIVAYFVAMLFFNVYTTAVDTLFLCFLEDCERNDGSPDRPYFMSKNLMKILGKKNKIH